MHPHSQHKAEIRRHWRTRYLEEMNKRGMPIPADFRLEEPGDGDLHPPDARRVARRACCLATVALRGLAATWEPAEQAEFLPRLCGWFGLAGLDDEIEPGELELIQTPTGQLSPRDSANATWRWEGVAVLVASLGRHPLPAYDHTVETRECGLAAGVLEPRDETDRLIETAAFDPAFDRFAYANQALAIHWRLRQFIQIEPKPMNFREYAAGVKWADFDLGGARLLENDLAIGDAPISRAKPQEISLAMSIASERHLAANWLIGWDEVYGDVENAT